MALQDSLGWARSHRQLWLSSFDSMAWGCAAILADWTRGDFHLAFVDWPRVTVYWILVVGVYTAIAHVVGLHRGRASVASLPEMLLLGTTVATTGAICFVVNLAVHPILLPRSVPLINTFLAVVFMAWGRACWRTFADRGQLTTPVEDSVPVLVFGAGDAGRQLIRSMLMSVETGWRPVALLDDDPAKRLLRLYGVRVRGRSGDIDRLAHETGATTVVVAIPSLPADRLRALSDEALAAGLVVKVLPGVAELLGDRVGIRDVRDLHLEDLLGRRQIELDVASIAGYLTGRRVLVTGAGGSIGSELCRQVHTWNPAELTMLDRDESALHAVQLSITGRALLDSPDVVLADIRDAGTLLETFRRHRPHVVFHAAALKHLPMLEQYPGEAVMTNVWGSLNVLAAAADTGVETFVNISTDKAAEPISVLGYSKRIAERLTADTARHTAGTYLSVRFGNVLGSRGSVLTSFAAQIASGGPVTVTDPHVTRYFMTVQEAVQLVIQAGAVGCSGEALVLDMGEPVNIAGVARRLIQLSGSDVQIVYTGLRQGEKLNEILCSPGEGDHRPVHPMISHVPVPPLVADAVRRLDPHAATSTVITALESMCRAHQLDETPRPPDATTYASVPL